MEIYRQRKNQADLRAVAISMLNKERTCLPFGSLSFSVLVLDAPFQRALLTITLSVTSIPHYVRVVKKSIASFSCFE